MIRIDEVTAVHNVTFFQSLCHFCVCPAVAQFEVVIRGKTRTVLACAECAVAVLTHEANLQYEIATDPGRN